jgi:hypothetical protein
MIPDVLPLFSIQNIGEYILLYPDFSHPHSQREEASNLPSCPAPVNAPLPTLLHGIKFPTHELQETYLNHSKDQG